MTAAHDFLAAIAATGLTPPGDLIADGTLHRFSTNGRAKDDAGWYVFHDDDRPAGRFGCNRSGVDSTWRADIKREFTAEEKAAWKRRMDEQRAARDAEAARQRASAASQAAALWSRATPANGHAYLERKGIAGAAAAASSRELDGILLVPVKHGPRELVGLQRIDADGGKKFLHGTPAGGGYTTIGKPGTGPVVIVEGYATGLTVHQATGFCVVIAFNAGNLEAVARKIRAAMPDTVLIIGADDDAFTEGNPGITAATLAARAVGARVVKPTWVDAERGRGTDFNDLKEAEGLQAVADCFGEPEEPEETIDPDTGEILTTEPVSQAPDARQPTMPMDVFAEFPAPPIRLEMLPDPIARYALECGQLIGVDPAMVAIPALVACAAALHDDVKIQPKRHETGWTESARLWCAIVGSPSVKKSPAIRRATKRLRKIDHDLAEDNAKLAASYAEKMAEHKEAQKEAKKTGERLTEPVKPAMSRMIVEDITVEALSEVLKDNSRGVLCIQDELSGWFGSMDAYSGGKAGNKDRAAWLQAYNGGFRQVDRVMRGSVHIPNFSVSMIGGIQPDAIRRIAKDMTDDGLMQRFMIVIGSNCVELDRTEDGPVTRSFADLLDHLHAISGGATPVTLDEDAHTIREALNAYSAELADYPALPGGLRSHLGKWSGLFARLLLIYHAIECQALRIHPSQRQVTGATAGRVDLLMRRFLLPHALAYYTDILGASGDLEHARWVAGHILSKRLDVISNRDLIQAYKQWRGLDDWRRQRVMQVLEDMGWLSPLLEDGKASKRGATNWAINLQVHTLFAEKARAEAERREKIRAEIAAMSGGQA